MLQFASMQNISIAVTKLFEATKKDPWQVKTLR